MNKWTIVHAGIAVMLIGFLTGLANATNEVIVAPPQHEDILKVNLEVTDSVSGNVSVNDGLIDFFVTSSSDNIILNANEIIPTFQFYRQ